MLASSTSQEFSSPICAQSFSPSHTCAHESPPSPRACPPSGTPSVPAGHTAAYGHVPYPAAAATQNPRASAYVRPSHLEDRSNLSETYRSVAAL